MPKRIRLSRPNPLIPAWNIDIARGKKYRIIRPEAAAEVIGLENEQRRFPLRQPDAWELEALELGQALKEKGQWVIQRTEVFAEEFAK